MSEAPAPELPPCAPPLHSAREAALLIGFAIGAILGVRELIAVAPALAGASGVVLLLSCVVPAYALSLARGYDPFVEHGVVTRPRRPLLLVTVSLVLLGGFLVAVELAARAQGWSSSDVAPQALAARLFNDLVTVAIAEEYLFRGVVQPAWDHPQGPRWRLLGAPFGRGALLSALVFGLVHPLVWLNPALAIVALPGLWFAWLRAAGGNVLVCALAHALANTLQLYCLTRYPELPSLLPWLG